jgi:hypothetical protein
MITLRNIKWIALPVLLIAASPGYASLVSVAFTGQVTAGSGDIADVFGVSSIQGDAITGSFTYDTGVFGPAQTLGCGPGCAFWDTTSGSLPQGTIQVSETINGVTVTTSGLYYSGLTLGNGNPPGSWPYGANSSGWVQTFQLWSEQVAPNDAGIDATEINLGTFDPSSDLVNSSLNPGGPFDLAAATVQVDGTGWYSPSGELSQWDFDITSAQVSVPEPASTGLLVAGLIGLGVARPRRVRNLATA